jgi:zinc transporter
MQSKGTPANKAMNKQAAPKGLIHALLMDGRGSSSEYPWDRVNDWSPDEGCLWLHFDFEQAETQHWLEHESGLNDVAFHGLVNPETRPRAVNRGDNLLLALRGINLNPGSEPDDMVSLRIWTNGHKVISTRRRSLLSTQDVLEDLDAGIGPCNATELLVSWTDRIIWRMSETVENFDDQVLGLEERVLNGEIAGIRLELARLRKQTISIRRYLAPQREAMNRLINENLSWLDDMNRLRLREVNDRLIRHIEDIDEVRERAAMAQEELLSRVSEQMNERTYVFTVVATIFLPLGFFTGLMGINVGGMPGVEDTDAFWIVVFMCLGLVATLAVLLRWKRWM